MTVRTIKVPDIGEGIAEVELVAWHVKPGDQVAEDQILAEVMTDKAAVEVPSPLAGQVVALGGEVGQTLAVGAELIRIEVAGSQAARATWADAAAAPAAPETVVTRAPSPPAQPVTADTTCAGAAGRHAAPAQGRAAVCEGTGGRCGQRALSSPPTARSRRPRCAGVPGSSVST